MGMVVVEKQRAEAAELQCEQLKDQIKTLSFGLNDVVRGQCALVFMAWGTNNLRLVAMCGCYRV